ncbi:cytosine/uracil/thiamine/allantoin permease [Gordonia spumicola]|uniref:Cytosine/uracil/thiamine/allantoin permease n=1 Tax=Gordonia spumicola TaxID=589161 RepID=A0A7I9V7F2_9ACTN|nr:cytosine permease [Gordonia spumicola]GEE01315.1 cytosine/uracil/thiamine/allantoin permease [Gordonia spumicola]
MRSRKAVTGETIVAEAPSTVDDATLNELPLTRRERIWGFWDYSVVNIGLAVATWAFLQGSAVAYYVGAKQAIATIAIGYGVAVFFVALAPCLPSAKYGVEQFIGLRSVFGNGGARVVMVFMSTLLAAAWSAVLAIMLGHGMVNALSHMFGWQLSNSTTALSIIAVGAVVVSWLILSRGPVSVERVCQVIAPLLILIIIAILVMVLRRDTWDHIASLAPLEPADDSHVSFMLAIEINIAGGFAWWPNMGNLARLTRTSRSAFWPNFLGIFGASVIAAVVGVFAALTLKLDDPTEWMIPLIGSTFGVLALFVVALANITAILSQGYASMVALRGGGGRLLRGVSWPALITVILGPAVVLVFFPQAVYDNYSQFLSWGALFLAPLCGVQIVDYFILRRRVLDVRQLYTDGAHSGYGYWRGVNICAFVSVGLGVVVYCLLLNPITYEPAGIFKYTTASVPSFLVAGFAHYVLTRLVVMPSGLGLYEGRSRDLQSAV